MGQKSTIPAFPFTNYDVIFQYTINSGKSSTNIGILLNQIDFARSYPHNQFLLHKYNKLREKKDKNCWT